jgi:hypothetical protein
MVFQGQRLLSFASPITGKIVSINAPNQFSRRNTDADPYVSGWVAILRPTRLASELRVLSIAEEATGWLKRELNRFRDFIKDQAGLIGSDQAQPSRVTLLDGGVPPLGALQDAGDETWRKFELEFLTPDRGASR